MAEPLDYFNPQNRPEAPKPQPVAPIDTALDCLLTHSDDRAAVRVIERMLKAEGIPSMIGRPESPAGVEMKLYVRKADEARAALIAAEVFVRRKRFRAMQAKKEAPITDWERHDYWPDWSADE